MLIFIENCQDKSLYQTLITYIDSVKDYSAHLQVQLHDVHTFDLSHILSDGIRTLHATSCDKTTVQLQSQTFPPCHCWNIYLLQI